MTMTPIPKLRIDAEAKGKLRAWRRAATERYHRLDDLVGTQRFAEIGEAFASKKGIGRDRAWTRLKHVLSEHGAHLQWSHQGKRVHYAVWALLHPGQSLTAEDEGQPPDMIQDSVIVEYLLIGGHRKMGAKIGRGVWSLEVPDHALARLVQRDRKADIDATILEAHNAALWMPYEGITDRGFALPAGKGAFLSKMYICADRPEDGDDIIVAVRPWTWLHHDQLTDEQERRMVTRAAKGQKTMGDTVLLPYPFWRKDLPIQLSLDHEKD